MGGNTISDNSMNPILAQVDQFLQSVSNQVAGPSAGKQMGNIIDQGVQSADSLMKSFMEAFGGGNSAVGSTASQCPKCPQPFSPSQFPTGIFDNPMQFLPKAQAGGPTATPPLPNDPGFNVPQGHGGVTDLIPNDPGFTVKGHHDGGINDLIPNDPGFNIPKRQDTGITDHIANDPGFTLKGQHDDRKDLIPNDPGFTPPKGKGKGTTDLIPNDPGFKVGGKSWSSEAAASRGGTDWSSIQKALEEAKRSGDPQKLESAQKKQQDFLNGCKLIGGIILNSAVSTSMTVAHDIGLR